MFAFCRKTGVDVRPQPQQSHLLDLLDIPMGATSISGPSQSSDPWGMPVGEAKTQVSLKKKKNLIVEFLPSYETLIALCFRHQTLGDAHHQLLIHGNRIPVQYQNSQHRL